MPDEPKPSGVALSTIINGVLVAVLAIITWNQKWAFDRINTDSVEASAERAAMWSKVETLAKTMNEALVEIKASRKEVVAVKETADILQADVTKAAVAASKAAVVADKTLKAVTDQ